MGTATKGFDARLANRPFLVFDLRALKPEASVRKSKTKNGRFSQPAVETLNDSVLFWEH